jgi:hypothetical protein
MAQKRKSLSSPGEPLLLTRDEVKATLKIGDTKLYELTNSGTLARVKIGAASRWTFASVKRVAGVAA